MFGRFENCGETASERMLSLASSDHRTSRPREPRPVGITRLLQERRPRSGTR